MESLNFNNFDIKAVNTDVSIVKIDNEEVIRVVKNKKINKLQQKKKNKNQLKPHC